MGNLLTSKNVLNCLAFGHLGNVLPWHWMYGCMYSLAFGDLGPPDAGTKEKGIHAKMDAWSVYSKL